MAKLRMVDGVIVLAEGDHIIGCVSRCNDEQWEFTPLSGNGVLRDHPKCMPLRYALAAAAEYDPRG